MRLLNFYKSEDIIFQQGLQDPEFNLRISSDIKDIDEKTVYFHMRKVGQEEYIFPDYSALHPFLTVCEEGIAGNMGDNPTIVLKNVRKALANAYSQEYAIDYTKIKVIGITGTNGKSSTAEILISILRESGYSVGYIGTGKIRINDLVISDEHYSMTTPDPKLLYPTISRMEKEGCDYIVMEVSSHALSLSKVYPIQFECGIFTNLSSEHLDFHNDLESYYQAKFSLFQNCRMGIFNIDDEYSRRAYHNVGIIKHSVGIINKANAYITDLDYDGIYGSTFFYREERLIFKVKTRLGGYCNIYNSLMAIKCAISLGVKPHIAKKAVSAIRFIPGRLECINRNPTVIIDYAHTPFAFENVLKTINHSNNRRQTKIIVFGCGGERDKNKRAKIGSIAEKYADLIIVTEDNSRNESFEAICSDILSDVNVKEKFTVIKSRNEAIRRAIMLASDDDIVALIGKGDEKYIIDNSGYHPFFEKELVAAALEERKKLHESKN